ncbi:MAG: T9SS type A sorting domain-containing protein, partial [Bacteroidaceae bacterium]|nr:T9SS type A sorting domain-containing protein [Bacteroidaceae bacterium]
WTIEPSLLAGYYTISVYYDGEEIESDEPGMNYCEVGVAAEASFKANGWDWIYVPGSIESIEEALADYNIDENNKVIEIRSQTAMLYNDPEYGFFGDIYGLGSWDGMYKIKSTFEDDSDRYIKAGYYWDQCYKTVYRGYNWIGYGNEWDMTIGEFNELNEVNQFGEGDFILSKDGIAVFDAEYNEWIASDNFMFEVGKGYIFYFANKPNMEIISFESYPHILFPRAARVKARKPENKSVWEFDASQFADNMAVVAELKNVDIPENYTVGAFVDGECRGMGKVAKNGIMLISVAGKAGEQVSFRLHNEMTGEFSEVKETTSYKMIAGSLKAPFSLTADGNGTTDINGVADINEDDIVAIYTLNGQKVSEMTEGVYIIQVRENGKIVTKKVKK